MWGCYYRYFAMVRSVSNTIVACLLLVLRCFLCPILLSAAEILLELGSNEAKFYKLAPGRSDARVLLLIDHRREANGFLKG